ncbi:uroporphyrinogen-III C-methyltransferase [Agrobacterium vitis]|uniref:Uroporphyrinogen-III C-methyltransferase n=1 Tax=Agrobacterium vitis TaxID=373 RepID=A0ABD6GDE5_AGRVI|nr:siroheme synthase CysG [Agrobacterium vitis]MUO81637.1 uroporphyrinogen-III C-methyltransferase [Agrobacterium vitis]MUO95219.1 uroporphyrinogen-III C-methyltransferase [Agrobacterium vitis]MUP07345.1 uroporphyrinogen-III C-methyltransferase [Agrobacterium vitis]MUZ83673.1 uroporphyrinogen-III C-methyltransferase [Agrobacterium vitis]MVA09273.1 uroporphyrinogen-III C-methyltransferase [Agrobacterium vitis]
MLFKSLPQNNSRRPERVAPLSKLPVFWALEGKRVIVAGGSEGAAWKAELLAACGADVEVFCAEDELSDTFRTLLEEQDRMVLHPHCWHIGIFENAALALADCETEDEAKAFYCAAKAAGVPVNVIDKPAYCQFQFGSIVNRSPVVVAISTDGAAPILGQAIRRRIETLLPPALKPWAELAQAIRGRINEKLAPGASRRTFWERFVDRAFAGNAPPQDNEEDLLLNEAARLANTPALGRVTLVGAGPGDAELLTLKAVRALQAADVILFDDLVSPDVLELARREAKRMLVGKRGGRESCKQDDINEMMVRFAKAGKRVVRLKSGDPMIFGRAGEEIARLANEGITVDVVPGITSASAMAAALGISLTHRDHAQSLRLVTGHSRHGDLPESLNWRDMADPSVTTIFYMGGRMAGRIAENLMAAGMASNTQAVAMTSISRAQQTSWRGTVGDLADAVATLGVSNPILIGVGAAFAQPGTAMQTAFPEQAEQQLAAS